MTGSPRETIIKYAIAVGVVVVVTLFKVVFINLLVGDQQWFLLFVAAICLSSWYGGMGPGTTTAVLSALSALFFFVPASGGSSTNPATLFQIVLFLVEGLLVVGLTGNLRLTRAAALASEREKDQALALLDTFQVYAPVGLAYLDNDLRYLRINYAMAELNGLTPAAHIGRTLQEVQPQIKPALIAGIRDVLETGKPLLDQELILTKPTLLGIKKQYLLTSYYRMRSADGEPLGIGAVMVDMTGYRQAEDAIHESEARFRTMADTAPVMIWVSGADKQVTYFNKVLLEFTGKAIEQELGSGWRDDIHPDDLENCLQVYTAAFDKREPFRIEYRLRRHDGEYRWVLEQGVPRYSPEGTFTGYISSCIDITERKQWEIGQQFVLRAGVMLAASLDYETTLASVAQLAVPTVADWCAVDLLAPDSRIERVAVAHVDPEKAKWAYELSERNPQTMDMEGGVQTALRTGETQFVPEITEAMIRAAAKTDEEFELAKSLGFTSVIIAPMVARGRAIGTLTLVTTESRRHYTQTDVRLAELLAVRAALSTDNARLVRDARSEQDRLRVTLSSIGDAVIATDADGHVTFLNPVAQRLTHWNQDEALGQPLETVFQIVNEYSREPVENPVTRVLREGRVVGLANHTILISKSGDEIPIDDSGAPIPGEDGSVSGVVLVFRDVSERKQAERRQKFLSDASSLLISSLDYETTLQNITQLAVPEIADWSIIYLIDGDGNPRQVAISHPDAKQMALREEMLRVYPPTPQDQFSHLAVLRSGKAELIELITEAMLHDAARNAEHLDMLHRLHYQSSIGVPLKKLDEAFGTLILRTTQGGRTFTEADLAVAEELGRVASLAIDNARLYRRAQGN